MKEKILDIVVVGSGLAALNFIDEYLKKGKSINLISPDEKNYLDSSSKQNIRLLPTQMREENINVQNYFFANKLKVQDNCKLLGSLNFGGLSNYWGLQLDNYLNNDQKLSQKSFNLIEKNFIKFLNKFKLIGSHLKKNEFIYKNEFVIPDQLTRLINQSHKHFLCKKPILGFFSNKNFKGNLNSVKEKKQKLNAENFYKKIKRKENIIFHNYFVKKIFKNKKYFEIICKNSREEKKLISKKIVFASGTVATTKILMEYLKIKKEIKIRHHPRLFSVFFSKKPLEFNLDFTPALLQIINKSKKNYFSSDLRPGNRQITESIIDAFPFMILFKPIINFFRHRLIFSNILLDSNASNIYIKKIKGQFEIYCKKRDLKSFLEKQNNKIFKFLLSKKIILPFFKTFFPGSGADYHYFGTIPFNGKGKLAVNENCQLNGSKNIYVIDGSVFNFKTNKYPLGIVMANARRIGQYLAKS